MMRLAIVAIVAVTWATRAQGADVDWRAAGGALFVTAEAPAPSAAAPALDEAPAPLRLPPLDQPYGEAIAAAAERFGLDPKLLGAVVAVESSYRADALSSAGAGGLTQLMPATAARLGVRDRFDPTENLFGGAALLALELRRFGDVRLALAAFNAGPTRVAALGRVPDIAETRAYVASVLRCFLALTAGRAVRGAKDCPAQALP